MINISDLQKARKIVAKHERWIGKHGALQKNITSAVAEGIALGRQESKAVGDMIDVIEEFSNWPQACTMLVDTLRSYVRISERTRKDLLSLGAVTTIDELHLARCRTLLKEIEEREVDPYLNDNCGPTGEQQ